jgi:2-methylcitrate synthase
MDIKYGLAGVLVDNTSISKVMPDINSLTYRGYPVQDLAHRCSFEEVAYLLLKGKLPNHEELLEFCELEKKHRTISPEVYHLLKAMPKDTHPMDVLRTAVSYLGVEKNLPASDYEKAVALIAKVPIIIAAFSRIRKGLQTIAPDTSLSFVENFFAMYFSKIPEQTITKAFAASLVLYAEHSFNASTFAGRVIVSTTSDIYSAIVGAIGALKGALHGGANEAVMYNFLEIKEAENAEKWILDALAQKKKIMGFGHRVYRSGDSRVPTMKKLLTEVAALKKNTRWLQIYEVLEKIMVEKKSIYPNLDFPAGPIYYLMGFDIDIFTPIFVLARLTGWSAHIFEQKADNKLIRPSCFYIGEQKREVIGIENRE